MGATDLQFACGPDGTPLFVGESCAVFRQRCHESHPDFSTRHRVQVPLLVFPRTAFRLSVSGGPPLVADRNTVVLLNVGDTFQRMPLFGNFADADLLAVEPGALRNALESLAATEHRTCEADRFPCDTVLAAPRLYLALRRLMLSLPDTTSEPGVIERQVLDILRDVVRLSLGRDHGKRHPRDTARSGTAVLQARLLLAVRVGPPLSLDEVAAEVHMSPYHLARAFKRQCGTSIHTYWMRLAMTHSLSLLRDPSLSVAGVSNRLGFCAHSHFSSTFRRHFGMTPRTFVRTLRPGSVMCSRTTC